MISKNYPFSNQHCDCAILGWVVDVLLLAASICAYVYGKHMCMGIDGLINTRLLFYHLYVLCSHAYFQGVQLNR